MSGHNNSIETETVEIPVTNEIESNALALNNVDAFRALDALSASKDDDLCLRESSLIKLEKVSDFFDGIFVGRGLKTRNGKPPLRQLGFLVKSKSGTMVPRVLNETATLDFTGISPGTAVRVRLIALAPNADGGKTKHYAVYERK